jgi:hypothetical protein
MSMTVWLASSFLFENSVKLLLNKFFNFLFSRIIEK